jgi:hypothetical protein
MGRLALLTTWLSLVLATPSFNATIGRKFLLYAYASYNLPQTGTWSCPYCIGDTRGMTVTADCFNFLAGSQSYVGYNPVNNEIIASFRGSSNIQDWIEDLEFNFTAPGQSIPGVPTNVQVEVGFWKFYESVQKCVKTEVLRLQKEYPSATVGITGHSLGGTAASLCAVDLYVNEHVYNISLYTFGEPRVGNAAYAVLMNSAFPSKFRVVNYKDCVPHLPPLAFQYFHEAYEVYETSSGGATFRVCNNIGEDKTCSDQWSDLQVNCNDHLFYFGIPCCDKP